MSFEKETNNIPIRSGVAEKTQQLLQNYNNLLRKNLGSGTANSNFGGRIHSVDSYKMVKFDRKSKSLVTKVLINDSSEALQGDQQKQ
jgi:hypothetical protein